MDQEPTLQSDDTSAANPMVTIVIPVYNGANYLREAIESALAQTYTNIEVIVINDGSDDNGETRTVALSFGDRIHYIEKKNGGVASALNVGIREMKGEYLSWLSHDDVYYPNKVARQIAHVQALKDDRALVFSNFHTIDSASRVIGAGTIGERLFDKSILLVAGTHVNGCSLLIPKAAFEVVGFFNESLKNSQDNEMWLRLVMEGYRLRYLPVALIQSRQHAEQGSLTTSIRHAQEARQFYVWALEFIGSSCRAENATGLFKVLLRKRHPAQGVWLFHMLRRERSLLFALSSVTKAILGVSGSWVIRRLRKVLARGSSVYSEGERHVQPSSHRFSAW